jgi:4-amino-4-deoxy-L-arabinose transferase-like glycosyltransferase
VRPLGGRWTAVGAVIGLLLAVTAVVLPPAEFIVFLRGSGPVTLPLVLGAQLFKIGLAILALLFFVLPRLPLWQANPRRDAAGSLSRPPARQPLVLGGLAVLLLVAAGLRLYGLESGAWLDEVLTYVQYMHLSFGQNITTFDSQNQHFVYSLLAHAAAQTFGDSIWSSRLPAALFGVGSIWAAFLLARQVASTREALLTAAFLTFSYQHIWYSQTARGYSGLLFWSLLASWLLLRAMREQRTALWILYAVAVALGAYTHMTMLFVVLGHFTIFVTSLIGRRANREPGPGPWPGLVLGFGLSAVLVLQLYALVLPQFFSGTLDEQSVVADWKNPLWTVLEVARSLETSLSGGVLILLPAAFVFGLGIVSYARERGQRAVLQLLIISCLACALVNIALGHHLWPRFFFFAAGFAVLVAVRGLVVAGDGVGRLLRLSPTHVRWVGTLACLAAIVVSARSIPVAYLPKQDFGGALAFIDANRQPGDAVAMAGLAVIPYRDMYKVDWLEVKTSQDLTTLRSRANRVWIVYTLPEVMAAVEPELLRDIQTNFRLVDERPGTLADGTVFVYRSDAAPVAHSSSAASFQAPGEARPVPS